MLKLTDAYDDPRATEVLYELLCERPPETWVSGTLPEFSQHVLFVELKMFPVWRMIKSQGEYLGCVQIEREIEGCAEVGVAVFKKHQREGVAFDAVQTLMVHYPHDRWAATINPKNAASVALFRKLGFERVTEVVWTHGRELTGVISSVNSSDDHAQAAT